MSSDDRSARDPFVLRRARLVESLGPVPIVVLGANADGGASENFGYLTGLAEARGALLLARDGIRVGFGRDNPGRGYQRGRVATSTLFLPPSDPLLSQWGEDASATLDATDPAEVGVDEVTADSRLDAVLSQAIADHGALRIVGSGAASLGGSQDPAAALAERVRRRYFGAHLHDATPHVHEMRASKDDHEVAAIARAIETTRRAMLAAWGAAVPGARESEVEAEIWRTYRRVGATHAFDPIVGSGRNACSLHYTENSRKIEAGELVLVDTGAKLDGYCADVTRTVPADGKFTKRQRDVYEIVLRALEAATARCAPGVTLGDVHEAAFDVIEAEGLGAAFMHGTSHHLGRDVHDVGDRFAALRPGAVITVEPGVYLPDEGIGIRIEDDVKITGDGFEVLTRAIPKAVDEVEAALAEARR